MGRHPEPAGADACGCSTARYGPPILCDFLPQGDSFSLGLRVQRGRLLALKQGSSSPWTYTQIFGDAVPHEGTGLSRTFLCVFRSLSRLQGSAETAAATAPLPSHLPLGGAHTCRWRRCWKWLAWALSRAALRRSLHLVSEGSPKPQYFLGALPSHHWPLLLPAAGVSSRATLLVHSECDSLCMAAGDKPDLLYPEAAAELAAMGYKSTIEYVAAAAAAVLKETGLLPHINAGGSWDCSGRMLWFSWIGYNSVCMCDARM